MKNVTMGGKNVCGDIIRQIRTGKHALSSGKMTQTELAARLESYGFVIDRITISRIETGSRAIYDIELIMIARVLNVSVMDLIPEDILPQIDNAASRVAEEEKNSYQKD